MLPPQAGEVKVPKPPLPQLFDPKIGPPSGR
jgi:hypothetical protein